MKDLQKRVELIEYDLKLVKDLTLQHNYDLYLRPNNQLDAICRKIDLMRKEISMLKGEVFLLKNIKKEKDGRDL